MERWSKCPGSVELIKDIPAKSSPYADEGTLAHEIAANMILGNLIPENIDDDMVQAVDVYIDYIGGIRRSLKPKKEHFLVEHKFDLSSVHPGLFGTADCVIYDPKNKTLRVIDYKHGKGIAVDAKNNLQLQYYGLGALLSLKVPCVGVYLTIVQPRAFHAEGPIRSWKIKAYDLLEFAADLKSFALETENSSRLFPGEHCRFCPASGGICPALKNKAQALAQSQFSVLESDPKQNGMVRKYDVRELSDVLSWLPTLDSFIKNARKFAYAEIAQGRKIPGWKLVAKRAARKWNVNEEIVADTLIETVKQDDLWTKKFKSPAQIEKLLGKNKECIQHLIESKSSGYNMVPSSDGRPEIVLDAKSQFDAINDETDENGGNDE